MTTENTTPNAVLTLTANIVSAHVANNSVQPDALPGLITSVFNTMTGLGKTPEIETRPGTRCADQEVGVPGLHHLPGRRQEAQDAQATPEHVVQHDAGPVSYRAGVWPPTIRWWRPAMRRFAPGWPRRIGLGTKRTAEATPAKKPAAKQATTKAVTKKAAARKTAPAAGAPASA